MSGGEPAAETMPFTRVRMEYCPSRMEHWPSKRNPRMKTLFLQAHILCQDISTYSCCQAKPTYPFLVFPHTKFLLFWRLQSQCLFSLTLLKLCTTFFAKHAKMPLLFHYSWTVLEASSPKVLMLCIEPSRTLSRPVIKSVRGRKKREKTSL